MTTHVVVVAPEHAGRRLDVVLAASLPELSRTQAARLVAAGDVLVGGRPASPSRKVAAGEQVSVRVPEPRASTLEPEDVTLSILHEDAWLIVLDKPAGLVVHPGAGAASGTLVNALLHHCGDSLQGVGGERRPGIVHRLDRGTSGVIVVAKTHEAHRALSEQFARRQVSKLYLAVVRGVPGLSGSVDAPIGRSTSARTRMSVGGVRGRQASTRWTRREVFGRSAALLEVELLTGRTHQVRVHLAHLRHPLVGDATYGPGGERAPDAAARPILVAFARPALHAWRLGFRHPATGDPCAFEAPVPGDLETLLRDLRVATRSR